MNKRYKLIIFDVDGTLLDTSLGIISSLKYTLSELGIDCPDDSVLDRFVGPRIQDSFEQYLRLEGEETRRASDIFRDRYRQGDVLLANLYEDVYKVLKYLISKEYILSIATNKRQDFVDALISKYELYPFFVNVFGTDMGGKLNKADLLTRCIECNCITETREVLLIGDSDYDAIAAKQVGIDFLAAIYGYGFKCVESANEFPNIGVITKFSDIQIFL